MHDVPDYKCNYKIILDSWENVPQLCYARVCSFREKQVKSKQFRACLVFHKVRRLLMSFCFIPLTFSLNATS